MTTSGTQPALNLVMIFITGVNRVYCFFFSFCFWIIIWIILPQMVKTKFRPRAHRLQNLVISVQISSDKFVQHIYKLWLIVYFRLVNLFFILIIIYLLFLNFSQSFLWNSKEDRIRLDRNVRWGLIYASFCKNSWALSACWF